MVQFAILIQSMVERSAYPGHLNEVVKMSRLQSGILAVVGEAEQLLVGGGKPLGRQLAQDGKGKDGGRGAPPFAAQEGQLGAFVGFRVVNGAAGGVEKQFSLHEPPPVGIAVGKGIIPFFIKIDAPGKTVFIFGVGPGIAAFVKLQPGFRKHLQIVIRVPGIFGGENISGSGALVFFQHFPEFPGAEGFIAAVQGNTVKRLPGNPAEGQREERQPVFPAAPEGRRVQGNDALSGCSRVQRGIHRAGLGNELVNLVWQVGIFGVLCCFIDRRDPAQQALQLLGADLLGGTAVCREEGGHFRK